MMSNSLRQNGAMSLIMYVYPECAMRLSMMQCQKQLKMPFVNCLIVPLFFRDAISAQTRQPWKFDVKLSTDDAESHVPKLLYTFIRWVVEGPTTKIQPESVRSAGVHSDVLAISQNILYCFKSRRQVMYKPKHRDAPFRHSQEWPQQLAVGMAVHQSTRSKKLFDFLHGFGLFVDYSQILRLETQLANSVI